jgi:hypothetical protein
MKKVTINLYDFTELKAEAKEKAIFDHSIFLDSLPIEVENEEGIMDDIYHKHTKEEVKESILINDYLFFFNGELSECTQYVENHPTKPNKLELTIEGEVFLIENN